MFNVAGDIFMFLNTIVDNGGDFTWQSRLLYNHCTSAIILMYFCFLNVHSFWETRNNILGSYVSYQQYKWIWPDTDSACLRLCSCYRFFGKWIVLHNNRAILQRGAILQSLPIILYKIFQSKGFIISLRQWLMFLLRILTSPSLSINLLFLCKISIIIH